MIVWNRSANQAETLCQSQNIEIRQDVAHECYYNIALLGRHKKLTRGFCTRMIFRRIRDFHRISQFRFENRWKSMKIAAEYKIEDFAKMELHTEIAMHTLVYFIYFLRVWLDLCGDRSTNCAARAISNCSHLPESHNRISTKIDENRENRENREFVSESYLDFRNGAKPWNSDNRHP